MRKILLVDDEPMIMDFQQKMLEKHDYQCQKTQTIKEAQALLSQDRFELALLDINLAGESGIELLNQIKDSYPEMAVIMITGNDDYNTAMNCVRIGADDYLSKPTPEGKLVISVRNAIAKKKLYLANSQHQRNLEEKLREQEEQLNASQAIMIQQEKLAAIGQLAAGVAHEINNPLGFIVSNLSSLRKYGERFSEYFSSLQSIHADLDEEQQTLIKTEQKRLKIDMLLEDLPDLINDAEEGTARIRKIIEGLKSFSRTDSDEIKPVDLNECLESAITIVWNEIKYNCKLEKDFGDLPTVSGYPQQLAQVFMNLLVNASHAIEKDGVIRLRTYPNVGSVIVEVSDNGSGISEENLVKIFDPFFTTKDVGKGTGLGMSIAREIIEKHKGKINVASVVGEGTTFKIELPANPS